MYLQGYLQNLFDALYLMGMIDPVLEMDWTEVMKDWSYYTQSYHSLISQINQNTQSNVSELVTVLKVYDEKTLCYLTIEVAKEFAGYQSRQILH